MFIARAMPPATVISTKLSIVVVLIIMKNLDEKSFNRFLQDNVRVPDQQRQSCADVPLRNYSLTHSLAEGR